MKKICLMLLAAMLLAVIPLAGSADGPNDTRKWMIAGDLAEYPENDWGRVWPQDRFLMEMPPNGSVGNHNLFSIKLSFRKDDEFKVAVISRDGEWLYSCGADHLEDREYADEGTDPNIEEPNIRILQDGQYWIDLKTEKRDLTKCTVRVAYGGPIAAEETRPVGGNAEAERPEIEGRWKLTRIGGKASWIVNGLNLLNVDMVYEFRCGCMTVDGEGFGISANTNGKGVGYTLDGNTVKCGFLTLGTYSVNGDTMTIKGSDGVETVFSRIPEYGSVTTSVLDGEWKLYDARKKDGTMVSQSQERWIMNDMLLSSGIAFYNGKLYEFRSVATFTSVDITDFIMANDAEHIGVRQADGGAYIAVRYSLSGDTLILEFQDGTARYYHRQ